jgi:hypothetical protein
VIAEELEGNVIELEGHEFARSGTRPY